MASIAPTQLMAAKAGIDLEARWGQAATAATNSRDPLQLAELLKDMLLSLRQSGYSSAEVAEHPAVVIAVAQLAELAGIDFHYPSRQLWQCEVLIEKQRIAQQLLSA